MYKPDDLQPPVQRQELWTLSSILSSYQVSQVSSRAKACQKGPECIVFLSKPRSVQSYSQLRQDSLEDISAKASARSLMDIILLVIYQVFEPGQKTEL